MEGADVPGIFVAAGWEVIVGIVGRIVVVFEYFFMPTIPSIDKTARPIIPPTSRLLFPVKRLVLFLDVSETGS